MPTDTLTQLATRRRFSQFLDQEWELATFDHASIALLILDVDFFTPFIDMRGQQAGDECLRCVADVIAGRVKRASDLAARYDGAEFAIVLSGAEEAGALSVAQWLRLEIERQQIPHGASSVSDYVTVSIGVAVSIQAPGSSPAGLMVAAEAALSRARELGRNAAVAGSASAS